MTNGESPATVRATSDGRTAAGREAGRLSDRVRRTIHERILRGDLPPGALIQTSVLAAELDVSRMPVREALLGLQQERLVEVVPNVGFMVRSISLADVRDIFVMRRVLEAATSERAAARITDTDLETLASRHLRAREQSLTAGYDGAFDELCGLFHRDIAAAAESERLLTGVETLFTDAVRLQSIGLNPPSPPEIHDEHEAILAAIRDRDPARARAAMERHVDTLRDRAVAAAMD